jgi:hypothetical protein
VLVLFWLDPKKNQKRSRKKYASPHMPAHAPHFFQATARLLRRRLSVGLHQLASEDHLDARIQLRLSLLFIERLEGSKASHQAFIRQ